MPTFTDYATGKHVYQKPPIAFFKRLVALPSYHLVLVACVAVLMAHTTYVPTWLVVLAVGSTLAQLPLIKHKLQQKLHATRFPIPRLYQMVQFGVFLFGVAGLWLTLASFSSDMSIAFLVLCTFCKLWELNTKRDAYVALNLCLFVLASAFLWSQGLGLSLVAMMALGTIMLGFIALADTSNTTGQGRGRTLAFLLLPSIPLLVVLFLFFPRLPPLWSLSLAGKQATTGVSDSMSPGDFANLSKSAELAFRAEFTGTMPERSEMYWRGLVFTEFDGITWTPSKHRGRFARAMENTPPDWARLTGGQAGSYKIRLEPTYQHWLFSLDYSYPQAQRGVMMSDKFTLGSFRPIGTQFSYAVDYYPNAKVGLTLNKEELNEALTLPKTGNEQAKQLGQALFKEAQNDPRIMVNLINNYIKDNQFSYTLSPPVLQDNRIDEFLFGTRAGFCEHYASSFVFLMRSAGVPARVVAGYQGGQLGRDGASWEVRQMDAHAWAEVWIENEGWVRVDPTGFVSPDRIFDGMTALTETAGAEMFGDGVMGQLGYGQFRLLQSIYRLSDQMSYYWQKQIVGFDQENQKNSLLQWFNITSLFQQVLFLAGGFVGLMAVVMAGFWYRNRKRYEPFDLPIVLLSTQLSKKNQALKKQTSESYLGYLTRIINTLPSETQADFTPIAQRYRQHRFGQHGLTDKAYRAKAHEFGKAVSALKVALMKNLSK